MSKATAAMANRRRQAREAGLCIMCCTRRPPSNRATCEQCVRGVAERRSRRKDAARRAKESRLAVLSGEMIGDFAWSRHLYTDAVAQYQQALTDSVTSTDHARISEKLARAHFLSDDPWKPLDNLTWPGFWSQKRGADRYRALILATRPLWLASKTQQALELMAQALQVAETDGDSVFCKLANMRIANFLNMLGRFNEAEKYLSAIGGVRTGDSNYLCARYYLQKGTIAAVLGKAEEAFEDFDRAVQFATSERDLYELISVLSDSAVWEMALGDTDAGKAHYEHALLLTRRNNMGWLLPQLCLGYSKILSRLGNHAAAHGYLLEALGSNVRASVLDERFAAFGIPLALRVGDEVALKECLRPAAIDLAFRSQEPSRIGSVAAAYSQMYMARGETSKARSLLHRALEFVNYLDECVDFVLAVARYGGPEDFPRTRALIQTRASLPTSTVAHATRALFEAHVAQRQGKFDVARRAAAEAMKLFAHIEWRGYVEDARSLLPATAETLLLLKTTHELGKAIRTNRGFTRRERQVVELVLKGSTNREVADVLGISEHTVEKHMTSIMGRIGIRSRHQLANILTETSSDR